MNDSRLDQGVIGTYPDAVEIPRVNLAGKRIIVMQGSTPVSVHDSLDDAMKSIGKQAARLLIEGYVTSIAPLHLTTVDR